MWEVCFRKKTARGIHGMNRLAETIKVRPLEIISETNPSLPAVALTKTFRYRSEISDNRDEGRDVRKRDRFANGLGSTVMQIQSRKS